MEVSSTTTTTKVKKSSGSFGGRLLKTLFDNSPGESIYDSKKNRETKSSSSKTGKPLPTLVKPSYTVQSVHQHTESVHQHTVKVKMAEIQEFGGYEEPMSTPMIYPIGSRLRAHNVDSHGAGMYKEGGTKSGKKDRATSKKMVSMDSPNGHHSLKFSDSPNGSGSRSSRTTSTDASYQSNSFDVESEGSFESGGKSHEQRERERQQVLIDRLQAEALKMKLEKAEEEMHKLRMELDNYRGSAPQSSVSGDDDTSLSRTNSIECSSQCAHSSTGGRIDRDSHRDPRDRDESGQKCDDGPSALNDRVLSFRSMLFVEDHEQIHHRMIQEEIEVPAKWKPYEPDLHEEPQPLVSEKGWRSEQISEQMYTFLQDAAAVGSGDIITKAQAVAAERKGIAVHPVQPFAKQTQGFSIQQKQQEFAIKQVQQLRKNLPFRSPLSSPPRSREPAGRHQVMQPQMPDLRSPRNSPPRPVRQQLQPQLGLGLRSPRTSPPRFRDMAARQQLQPQMGIFKSPRSSPTRSRGIAEQSASFFAMQQQSTTAVRHGTTDAERRAVSLQPHRGISLAPPPGVRTPHDSPRAHELQQQPQRMRSPRDMTIAERVNRDQRSRLQQPQPQPLHVDHPAPQQSLHPFHQHAQQEAAGSTLSHQRRESVQSMDLVDDTSPRNNHLPKSAVSQESSNINLFQHTVESIADQAAYHHQQTMEKLYNARRNRESLLLASSARAAKPMV